MRINIVSPDVAAMLTIKLETLTVDAKGAYIAGSPKTYYDGDKNDLDKAKNGVLSVEVSGPMRISSYWYEQKVGELKFAWNDIRGLYFILSAATDIPPSTGSTWEFLPDSAGGIPTFYYASEFGSQKLVERISYEKNLGWKREGSISNYSVEGNTYGWDVIGRFVTDTSLPIDAAWEKHLIDVIVSETGIKAALDDYSKSLEQAQWELQRVISGMRVGSREFWQNQIEEKTYLANRDLMQFFQLGLASSKERGFSSGALSSYVKGIVSFYPKMLVDGGFSAIKAQAAPDLVATVLSASADDVSAAIAYPTGPGGSDGVLTPAQELKTKLLARYFWQVRGKFDAYAKDVTRDAVTLWMQAASSNTGGRIKPPKGNDDLDLKYLNENVVEIINSSIVPMAKLGRVSNADEAFALMERFTALHFRSPILGKKAASFNASKLQEDLNDFLTGNSRDLYLYARLLPDAYQTALKMYNALVPPEQADRVSRKALDAINFEETVAPAFSKFINDLDNMGTWSESQIRGRAKALFGVVSGVVSGVQGQASADPDKDAGVLTQATIELVLRELVAVSRTKQFIDARNMYEAKASVDQRLEKTANYLATKLKAQGSDKRIIDAVGSKYFLNSITALVFLSLVTDFYNLNKEDPEANVKNWTRLVGDVGYLVGLTILYAPEFWGSRFVSRLKMVEALDGVVVSAGMQAAELRSYAVAMRSRGQTAAAQAAEKAAERMMASASETAVARAIPMGLNSAEARVLTEEIAESVTKTTARFAAQKAASTIFNGMDIVIGAGMFAQALIDDKGATTNAKTGMRLAAASAAVIAGAVGLSAIFVVGGPAALLAGVAFTAAGGVLAYASKFIKR